jgi:hypothetical protein
MSCSSQRLRDNLVKAVFPNLRRLALRSAAFAALTHALSKSSSLHQHQYIEAPSAYQWENSTMLRRDGLPAATWLENGAAHVL